MIESIYLCAIALKVVHHDMKNIYIFPILKNFSQVGLLSMIFIFLVSDSAGQKYTPFNFYSSQIQDSIEISTLSGWERQCWEIQQAMQSVMGQLPSFEPLQRESLRYLDTLENSTYVRYRIEFQACEK